MTSTSGQQQELPRIAVSDVTPEVFELVLEFVYSGALRFLTPKWLKATNAELLFKAADWYLMPLLKVHSSLLRCMQSMSCYVTRSGYSAA